MIAQVSIKSWIELLLIVTDIWQSVWYSHLKFKVSCFLAAEGIKGAVSRNSAKLGNYNMPIKLSETWK